MYEQTYRALIVVCSPLLCISLLVLCLSLPYLPSWAIMSMATVTASRRMSFWPGSIWTP